MIALPTEFPFIRVNAETLALCESAWLRETLRTAAAKTQDVPPWLAEDVSKGVEAFLRNHYEGTVIEVADLFERIRAALENLGLNHMAAEVETVVPPVRISFADLARRAGAGYELAFFRLLDDRLRASADGGVRTAARKLFAIPIQSAIVMPIKEIQVFQGGHEHVGVLNQHLIQPT